MDNKSTTVVSSKIVSDKASVKACQNFATDHRLLVEPACGASLSLCYDKDNDLKKHKNILFIVCGGSAVTPELLMKWSGDCSFAFRRGSSHYGLIATAGPKEDKGVNRCFIGCPRD